MARPRILLTGFGPFPGVPENPSGWLAETFAAQSPAFDCDLHARVLPTEWDAVALLAAYLHESLQPHVMIHFGVSPRAKRLRIERSAHNRAAARHDDCGALPATPAISPQGAVRLDTTLPIAALATHLRASGLSAATSTSCGRYLCNFLYYRSLEWAKPRGRGALFVHVPPLSSQGGMLTRNALLHAAHETLRFILDFAVDETTQRVAAASAQSPVAPCAEYVRQ